MFKTLRRLLATASVLCVLLSHPLAQARPELGPPSIKLRSNVANVIVARLQQRSMDGELSFTKVLDLHSEAPAALDFRVQPSLAASLQVGSDYILAYIGWRLDRFSKVLAPRTDGPVLISLPGATPAVFADSPLLRQMLSWDLEESQYSPEALLPLIRAGLNNPDWQYQEFFVTELATRFPLHTHLSTTDRQLIVKLALDPATSPYVPQFLFYNGDFLGAEFDVDVRVALARHVIREQALRQDSSSGYPALIRTAMHYLAEHGSAADGVILTRWLWSNHHGLIEGAMEAMRTLDVQSLPELIDRALAQSLLDEKSRRVMENYQRRLDAIRQQQS